MEPRTRLRTILPWIAAIILTATIVGVAVWNLRKPEPGQVMRFDYELPEGQQFRTTAPMLAVSPDGRKIVYSTGEGLYLRSIDELEAKLISGTGDNLSRPFFSPDGNWVGYISGGQLKKIALSGGAPVILTDAAASFSLISWGMDNTIVYGTIGKGIVRVSANGGTPEDCQSRKRNDSCPSAITT
jgi:Tol biopolymer transport system component